MPYRAERAVSFKLKMASSSLLCCVVGYVNNTDVCMYTKLTDSRIDAQHRTILRFLVDGAEGTNKLLRANEQFNYNLC